MSTNKPRSIYRKRFYIYETNTSVFRISSKNTLSVIDLDMLESIVVSLYPH